MMNLINFFKKLKTVTTNSESKSDTPRALEAGIQSMSLYLEQDLSELTGSTSGGYKSSNVALAHLHARACAPWQQDESLLAIWQDDERSAQVVDQLLKLLSEMATQETHRHHRRAAHLIEFLRERHCRSFEDFPNFSFRKGFYSST